MVARVVLLVVLVACERDKAVEKAPPSEPCFADELGELRAPWTEVEGCTAENAGCRDRCAAGDGDACLTQAIAIQAEGSEPAREKLATTHFKAACRTGLALGCTNWAAALLFDDDDGTSTSCLYRVFDRACAAGEAFGCSMTARILLEWPRTPVDHWIGYSQLVNACDKLQGPPCRFLAYYIELEKFETPDPARIKALMKRACDGKDVEACGKDRAVDAMN